MFVGWCNSVVCFYIFLYLVVVLDCRLDFELMLICFVDVWVEPVFVFILTCVGFWVVIACLLRIGGLFGRFTISVWLTVVCGCLWWYYLSGW